MDFGSTVLLRLRTILFRVLQGVIFCLLLALSFGGMLARGLRSKMILTVHDSIVFDVVKEERDELARLCYKVVNNLPIYIRNYFNFTWHTVLECEVEVGSNYANLNSLSEEELK